ncbi:MAG: phthalate 4,5-dioxygenase [Chloroflexi bacterium]|nr:phthalate 4,5-dioxygenase [Chloroflexota bacterium]
MLTKELNDRLCMTGPGTPGGEFLRRYWQPVGLSQDVKAGGKPFQIRIMSEDLVLFRDDLARAGLVGLHCSHRLTSLAYGRVEDGGIRCPFHGWLYDVEGRCLEQPAEPESSTFKERVRHTAYPCQELGGIIFAYMGPAERIPLLPRYEVLVSENGTRQATSYTINCNYMQNIEGTDATHFLYLHTEPWSLLKPKLFSMQRTQIAFEEADYGLFETVWQPHIERGGGSTHHAHFVLPAGFLRMDHRASRVLRYQSWYVPMDDMHTYRVQVGFAPLGPDGAPYMWRAEEDYTQPGPENDYFRDYEHVDTISGIPGHSGPGTATKGFLCQDNMANETEGPIMDRSREHLGSSDRLIAAIRKQMLMGIAAVERGGDPKNIFRDTAQNVLIRLPTGDEEPLSVAGGAQAGDRR